MNRPLYAQRLNRDVVELFAHNFNCSSSSLTVTQTSDSLQSSNSLTLQISIYEGPYRGGCFIFGLTIPESYPFRPVEIYATQPIWHPNIDLFTGKVALPIEWSPVLTLNSIALAVQMLLLEPSAENPLNMDAYSYYISQSDTFEQLAQKSILGGCNISGVKFQSVCIREPIQGLPWQQQASNSQQLPNRATDGRSDDGVFNPARMSPISSHLYLQRSNNTSTTSMSMNGNDTASSEGQEGQEGQEGGCSSSNSCSVMDSYSPMSASSGSARAISRSNDSMGSLQGNGSSGCNINIGLDFSAPHFSPAALATGTVASGGRAKKRSYDETENLPMQMEQYRLACNPSMPSAADLVRMSSMEISNAYSQLSLSSGGASTGGASAGGAGAGVGFRVPEGMNTINNSIQQDMALQRMQQHQQQQNAATGMYTNNSNINNNHHHSMGFGVLSPRNGGSESSLNGMEVCSPHKKVRFFADPSGTASRTNMDEGLNNL